MPVFSQYVLNDILTEVGVTCIDVGDLKASFRGVLVGRSRGGDSG